MILRTLRLEKAVTQQEVANNLGVKRYTYAKWEQGRSEPSVTDLIKLCEYFNCTFEYLVGIESDCALNDFQKANLTDKESECLASFGLLTEEDQNKVLGFIKAL